MLEDLNADHKLVITLEDGILDGGFGEKIARFYGPSQMKVLNYGLKKEFLDRYDVEEVLKVNHLTKEQLKSFNWEQLHGYGYGNLMRVMIDESHADSMATNGEFGWDGWLGCYTMMDPVNDLGIIYAIQKCGGNGFREVQTIRNIVYSAL